MSDTDRKRALALLKLRQRKAQAIAGSDVPPDSSIPPTSAPQAPQAQPSFLEKAIASARAGSTRMRNAPKAAGNVALGGLQAAPTIASGIGAQAAGGLHGLTTGAISAAQGGEFVAPAAQASQQLAQQMTLPPMGQSGQRFLKTAAEPFEMLQRGAERAGGSTTDLLASNKYTRPAAPLAGTLAQMAVEFAPIGPSFKGYPAARQHRERMIGRGEAAVDAAGVSPDLPRHSQLDQLTTKAMDETAPSPVRGYGAESVYDDIAVRRSEAKAGVGSAYDEARATKAFMPVESLRELGPRIRDKLRDYNVDDMKEVKKFLAEIEQTGAGLDKQGDPIVAVSLREFDDFRKKINNHKPSYNSDRPQNVAMSIMNSEMGKFMDDTFDSDMIRGDQTAVQKWKAARSANAEYRQRFEEDKVIAKFVAEDADPMEVRNWIFGASAVGAKKEAARTVRKIKELIGADSPSFKSLQSDAKLDLMEPLLREEPSFTQFVKNYDRMVRSNPQLADELFPGDQRQALKHLRDVTKAVESRPVPMHEKIDLARAGAVALFGHGLSKAALKTKLAKDALRRMFGKPMSDRREIMSRLMGYDPYAGVFPPAPLVQSGAIQTMQEQQQAPTGEGAQ